MNRIFVLCLLLVGCRSEWLGDLSPNQAPETLAVVDSIQRSGPDRLPTTVRLHWWGSDPDGVVDRFDFRIGQRPLGPLPWSATRANDTLLLLNLPPGPDTADFELQIRAVDQEGLPDPSPARLFLPLRNTAPQVSFVYNPDGGSPLAGAFPLVSFPVLGYRWQGTDDDGDSTILYYEICLNDTLLGDTLRLSGAYQECILQWRPGSGLCTVLAGTADLPHNKSLAGLTVEDTNRLYVRAIDQSLSASAWTASRPTYVRMASANLLLVNAYGNDPNPDLNADSLSRRYGAWLDSLNLNPVQELRLFQKSGNQYTQLSANNRVQALVLALFPRILWIAPDFDLSLQFTSRTVAPFLAQGGDLLLSSRTDAGTPAWTPAYETSPIDSVPEIPSGYSFLLSDTSGIIPVLGTWNGQALNLPPMSHKGFASGSRPLRPGPASVPVYKANLLVRNDANPAPPFPLYQGPSTCMVLKYNSLTGSSYLLTSLELHRWMPPTQLLVLLEQIKTKVWMFP